MPKIKWVTLSQSLNEQLGTVTWSFSDFSARRFFFRFSFKISRLEIEGEQIATCPVVSKFVLCAVRHGKS